MGRANELLDVGPIPEPAHYWWKRGDARAYLSCSGGNPTITSTTLVLKMASQAADLLLRYERELPGICAEARAAGRDGDWEARKNALGRATEMMRWINILKEHV